MVEGLGISAGVDDDLGGVCLQPGPADRRVDHGDAALLQNLPGSLLGGERKGAHLRHDQAFVGSFRQTVLPFDCRHQGVGARKGRQDQLGGGCHRGGGCQGLAPHGTQFLPAGGIDVPARNSESRSEEVPGVGGAHDPDPDYPYPIHGSSLVRYRLYSSCLNCSAVRPANARDHTRQEAGPPASLPAGASVTAR